MKIRNGFVSNSSSSSFIVAVEDGDGTEVKLLMEVDLAKLGTVVRTEEEVTKAFKDEYLFDDLNDDFIRGDYEACLKAIKDGKIVIIGSFASDGSPTEQYLCEAGIPETPGVDVIQSEGGY